ncbi:MAG: MBL fold metallo-hydrolase [Muribaculum sp.]|nr:MBL fold metallo-hydrolase [Muribaculum sp.]
MKITIHRGSNQIGGCVTEYEEQGWRLFVDYGEQLPGTPHYGETLQVEGLTHGDISKSALLITHYHGDHIGLIGDLPSELPIYIGETARDIQMALSEHLRYVDDVNEKIIERMKSALTFKPGVEFKFGSFRIMPIVMDHSAFDAYAFRIEADDLKVFHTGDFRTHGFRSSKLPKVIEKYVGKVDYVVCEATNVNRPYVTNKPEHELQEEFETAFKENKYNVVYLSSTNIDRLFALYHAALRAKRPFYVDAYQNQMMDIVTNRDKLWGKSRLYQYDKYKLIPLQREGAEFRVNDKFVKSAEEKGYVLVARANQRFDNLIERLPGEIKVRYLSMWKGYVDPDCPAYNPNLAKSLGTDFKHIHTSGHCDMGSLWTLLSMLKPRAIIPIHTDNPKAFADLFSNDWPVVLLADGESINVISYKYVDPVYGCIYAVRTPDEDIREISNPSNLPWYSLDERSVGTFRHEKDASSLLKKTIYSPDRLLGYEVVEEEDMEVWLSWHYDRHFKPLHNFVFYGEPNYGKPQSVEFKAGEKMLALIPQYNVVLPCEIIEDKEVKNLTDKIHIRCLVRVAGELGKMTARRSVQAIQLYPYQDFKF